MSQELILVSLTNGDSAVFLNGSVIASCDANEHGADTSEIAKALSQALALPLQEQSLNTPADSDWNWGDAYELLPPMASSASVVPVKYWGCYAEQGAGMTHAIDVHDQRKTNGQLYVDVGALEGSLDDLISVTAEINTNPLNGIDHVPCLHVHFDGDNLAFSLFKIGDRILMRPETHTTINKFRHGINGVNEVLLWVDADEFQAPNALRFTDKTSSVCEVLMSDVVGEYETPDLVPEWQWIGQHASFAHRENGQSGVWEFMLNLGTEFTDAPQLLVPVIAKAKAEGMHYILFHQGT